MIRTLRAAQRGRYASFPTVYTDADHVYVFYRLAAKGRTGTHGSAGRVRCLKIAKDHFKQAFEDEHPDRLYDYAQDQLFLFGQDNEMDSIISQITPTQVTLTTRTFDRQRVMRNFVSLAPSVAQLDDTRHEVPPPADVQWFAFYGHAVAESPDTWLFPAYGCLNRRKDHQASFLLETTPECHTWRVRQVLPPDWDVEVNECSLVQHQSHWYLFMRQRKSPFGIWMTQTADLKQWQEPKLLCEAGHAPMALSHSGRLYLGLRHILEDEKAATSLMLPLEEPDQIHDLDIYEGNVYDGGYCDLAAIDDEVYAFYYHGNPEGEPELRCAKPDLAKP